MLRFSIIIVVFIQANCLNANYYWREYTGCIPSDAFVGGKDINGKNVYIGQAYVKDAGLVVVQINPGIIEVHATIGGLRKISRYIKILCGPQNRFEWVPTTPDALQTLLLGKHGVVGGHEDSFGKMHIGRIKRDGSHKIGKINSFSVEAAFYYDNNGKEVYHPEDYEVLVYKKGVSSNNETDCDIKKS